MADNSLGSLNQAFGQYLNNTGYAQTAGYASLISGNTIPNPQLISGQTAFLNEYERIYQQNLLYNYEKGSVYSLNPFLSAIGSAGSEPEDPIHKKYKKRKLKEYSSPDFSKVKDILPKDIAPHAVMCPKEDIKNRIAAYLTN